MSEFKTYLKTDLSRQIEILKDKKVNLKNYIRKEILRKFIIYLAINAIYILVTLFFMNGFLFFIWFAGNFFFTIIFSSKLFDTSGRMKSFRKVSINSKDDFYFEFPKLTKNVDQKVNAYILDCKKLIFKPIIELFLVNINYFPQKFFKYEKVIESNLFPGLPEDINKYNKENNNKKNSYSKFHFKGSDAVEGYFGDNYIEFCELDISESYESLVGETSGKTYREIFHGLFLIADYKNIQFKTVLQSEFLGSFKSGFDMSILNFREEIKLKKIKVQNFKFNKHFSVYSQDDIEARKILSPVILENLGNFAEENNMTIKLSFINNQVFIALGIGQIFEPDLRDVLPLRKINLDLIEKDAERIYNEISLVSDIIKDLRLNSPIQSD
tara:strand:+ start:349 stop:1497 length:1149 start_codon:yes stop_codon:yes gene_type:complete